MHSSVSDLHSGTTSLTEPDKPVWPVALLVQQLCLVPGEREAMQHPAPCRAVQLGQPLSHHLQHQVVWDWGEGGGVCHLVHVEQCYNLSMSCWCYTAQW